MSWIKHPVTLEGKHIRLVPLVAEHFDDLLEAAQDLRIWEQQIIDGSNKNILFANLREALLKRSCGEQYPFSIQEKSTKKIIGITRLFEIFEHHKKVEIGWTWYGAKFWGSGLNTECKLLLLTYCFEKLKVNRVQLKTRISNERSRKAILKTGAKQEGILRNDRIMPNGETRDTVMFSIIKEEWQEVKKQLLQAVENIAYKP